MMMMMMMMMKRAMFRQFSSVATFSRAPTSMTVRNVISKHIRDLSRKRDYVNKLEETISDCRIDVLDKIQGEVLRYGHRVWYQLTFLQKLAKEIKRASEPCTSAPIIKVLYKHLEDLHQQLLVISQLQDSIAPDVSIKPHEMDIIATKPGVLYSIDAIRMVIEDVVRGSKLPLDDQLMMNPVMPKASAWRFNAVPNLGVRISMKITETVKSGPLDKHRYLLVLNGCEIFCLDLKLFKHLPLVVIGDVPPLLPITTYNLLEEFVPTAVSLIKWRSDAIMIGALKLPRASEMKKPDDIKLFRALDESDNMGKPKKLEILPLTEEINDEIHVIDCLGSHAFCDCDTGCWEEVPIPTVDEKNHIKSSLVVGSKIYAVSEERGFLVFNPRKNTWCVNSSRAPRVDRGDVPRDVWDILERFRVVRCAGGFPYGHVNDPLYVVIALENDFDHSYNGTQALAFLVTSSGRVVCFQRLTRRFFTTPVLFRHMIQGTIIDVEEDKLGKYKTMCSIIAGSPWEDSGNPGYLLINIFTVEELPKSADKVQQLKKCDGGPVELEFARIHVTERHVFKTEAKLHGEFVNEVQACFL